MEDAARHLHTRADRNAFNYLYAASNAPQGQEPDARAAALAAQQLLARGVVVPGRKGTSRVVTVPDGCPSLISQPDYTPLVGLSRQGAFDPRNPTTLSAHGGMGGA
jgi:hypothetical protein